MGNSKPTVKKFFDERTVSNFIDKLEEYSDQCKHIKHMRKMISELKTSGQITSGFSEDRTIESALQIENNIPLQQKVSKLKSDALAVSYIADEYAKAYMSDASSYLFNFFDALSVFLFNFGKMNTGDFILQKESFVKAFERVNQKTKGLVQN